MVRTTLSAAEARRVALAAQGIGRERAGGGTRAIRGEIARMGVLQIDSVNVFARSHYMPLFSRLGAYDPADLDRVVLRSGTPSRPARFVEYLPHEAAFMPVDDWPLWGFRRADVVERSGRWGSWAAENASAVDRVRAELADRGALRAGDIESVVRRADRGPWWDWDHAKRALEYLWSAGEVVVAGRRGFERLYAPAEHVVAPELLAAEVPRHDAIRELVRRAARAYGVSTVADLNDYYRLRAQVDVRAAVRDLVDAGELIPVEVDGWRDAAGRQIPAFLHRGARVPRRVETAALLSPFDPVVWFRDRTLRLFDFHYRIEIYVPQPKRAYGYYSLPLVVDDRIAGRIDLKADRGASTLLVQSAWWEGPAGAADRVAAELRRAAAWQGLDRITVSRWGDASDHLAAALAAERHEHPNAGLPRP